MTRLKLALTALTAALALAAIPATSAFANNWRTTDQRPHSRFSSTHHYIERANKE